MQQITPITAATRRPAMPAVVDTSELMQSIPSVRTVNLIARDSPTPSEDDGPCPKIGRATIYNIVAAWFVCLAQAISVFAATSVSFEYLISFDMNGPLTNILTTASLGDS